MARSDWARDRIAAKPSDEGLEETLDSPLSRREISFILRRAAESQRELDRLAEREEQRLTLADLERIGQDAGIDPDYVRRAADRLTRKLPSLTLGAWFQFNELPFLERVISQTPSKLALSSLAFVLRRELADPAEVTTSTESFSFRTVLRKPTIHVVISYDDRETRIRVGTPLGKPRKDRTFEFESWIPPMCLMFEPGAMRMLPTILVPPILMTAGYLVTRAIQSQLVRWRRRQLKKLLEAIVGL